MKTEKPRIRISSLRMDPTRTLGIQTRFMKEFQRRLRRFKESVRNLVEVEDAFGLKPNRGLFEVRPRRSLTSNTRFRFLTDDQKLVEFQKWLAAKMKEDGIIGNPDAPASQWWTAYINDAYRQGIGRVFDDFRSKPVDPGTETGVSDFYRGTRTEFLSSAFNSPVSAERVKLLASRTFTDVQGMTDALAMDLRRSLTDGIARGQHPRQIARGMTEAIDSMTRKRAYTIARTETARAHSDGQLDALEKLGVEEIGVMVEWNVTNDFKVCNLCRALEGVVLKVKEARGLLPRHPNCRCAYIPANVGEDHKDQIRGQEQVEKALEKSIQAEDPKSDLEEAKKKSRWNGADQNIAKVRPKSILDPDAEPIGGAKEEDKTGGIYKTPYIPLPNFRERTQTQSISQRLANPELEEFRTHFIRRFREVSKPLDTSKEDSYRTMISDLEGQINSLRERYKEILSKEGKTPADKSEMDRINGRLTFLNDDLYKFNIGLSTEIRSKADRKTKNDIENLSRTLKEKDWTVRAKIDFLEGRKELRYVLGVGTKAKTQEYNQNEHYTVSTRANVAKSFYELWLGPRLEIPELNVPVRILPNVYSRAFYSPQDSAVYVHPKTTAQTHVHEIAHWIEGKNPNIGKTCKQFLAHRIEKSGSPDVFLYKKFPGHGYGRDEVGNPDDFEKLYAAGSTSPFYVGKKYDDNFTEVFSMGVELLLEDPVSFAEKDPEYFKFVTGLLRGVL